MPEPAFLIRNEQAAPSQDFAFLRKAGIEQIQKLASELWTDYNVHDPGITLLEMLCYGITDLGYRTDYDLKDLLTRSENGLPLPNEDFHLAREILTNEPLSFRDLRKMLVDIRGVRHAWIEAHRRVQYGIQENQLAEKTGEEPDCITLNGLFDVYVEFEEFVDDLKLGLKEKASGGKGKYERPEAGKMRFTVERELVIRRVHVYADCKGKVVVSLKDQDGKRVLNQQPRVFEITEAHVKTPLDLHFLVVPPEDPNNAHYVLEAAGEGLRLFMHIGEEYCFEIDDLIEILPPSDKPLDTSLPAKYNYFFFYDWVIDFPVADSSLYPGSYKRRSRLGRKDYWGKPMEAVQPDGMAMLFNVEKPLRLEAVHVFGDAPGKVRVTLSDFKGEVLKTKTIDIHEPRTRTRVELGIDLAPFQAYRLEAYSEQAPLFMNREVEFPYLEPEVITLLGGTHDGKRLEQFYPFFYDWEIVYEKTVSGEAPAFEFTKQAVLARVRDKLLAHRNLCQDLVCVHEIRPEEVGICADIDLASDAPVEEILAEIFYRMEEHVKPSVRFHTLEAMREKGKSTDHIFNGPPLDHGFIDDEAFEQLNRSRPIYASDLIQLLMDIPGLLAVKNLRIVSFIDDRRSAIASWTWCPHPDPCLAPNFSPARSRFVFHKKGLPFHANQEEALALLKDKEARDLRMRYLNHPNNLPVPLGEDMEVADHFPLQNDLPLNYMVGQYGVPESESVLRKAQARQLKAYLAFFEQLFANYLAQLAHTGELFSWREAKVQTYFTQPLDEIDALDELYIDYPRLKDDLEKIIETTATAQERKLRFQEHLLARFSESFTDYSLLMFQVMKDREEAAGRVIEDKRRFLAAYPQMSSARGMGYDYRFPREPENISGFKRRVYGLLGISDASPRFLAGQRLRVQADGHGGWHFVLKDEQGAVLFTSVSCPTEAAVETMLDFVLGMVAREGQFGYRFNPCGDAWEWVLACGDASQDQVIGTLADPEIGVDVVIPYLKTYGNAEGFHLVEHILLRKHSLKDPFMPVQNTPRSDCHCVQVRDPYSFRASVILPAWSPRFQDLNFRQLVEDTLRREAPAHILLRICWIRHSQMREFERCLDAWECELACLDTYLSPACTCCNTEESRLYAGEINKGYKKYRKALRRLIDKLHRLKQVYPPARLHDCDTITGSKSQFTLGRSNLSTFG